MMNGTKVKTVFSAVHKDPREVHHPEPGCPERRRIEREGNAVFREVEDPGRSLLASGPNGKGGRMARLLNECQTCRSLRIWHRRMSARTPTHPGTAGTDDDPALPPGAARRKAQEHHQPRGQPTGDGYPGEGLESATRCRSVDDGEK